ncbi:MAG: hypothetical protein KDA79_18610, partial [Planctomycetaceae bacterium]|nr:hypothetical protein [Planctomycetaceae bacterium]
MVWEQLRGHAGKAEMFRRSVGRGRLSHAWLFSGPAGTGRRLFAHLLAQCLFCTEVEDSLLEACGHCHNCRQMQAGSHPDLLEVACPPDKSVLPIESLVGVTERRGREGLCYELSLRPMSASRRVAVINDAQLMNPDGANSLL